MESTLPGLSGSSSFDTTLRRSLDNVYAMSGGWITTKHLSCTLLKYAVASAILDTGNSGGVGEFHNLDLVGSRWLRRDRWDAIALEKIFDNFLREPRHKTES